MSSIVQKVNTSAGSIVLLVALIVILNVVPFLIARKSMPKLKLQANSMSIAPAPIVFAVVWPLLYTCLAVAIWLLYASQDNVLCAWLAFGALIIQLGFNWAWVPLYASEKYRKVGISFIIVMLMLSLISFTFSTKGNIIASALTAPYIAWLLFALCLVGNATNPVK